MSGSALTLDCTIFRNAKLPALRVGHHSCVEERDLSKARVNLKLTSSVQMSSAESAYRERLSFFKAELRDPAKHDGLAIELAYLRAKTDDERDADLPVDLPGKNLTDDQLIQLVRFEIPEDRISLLSAFRTVIQADRKLQPSVLPVKPHACHCDLEPGQAPEACVFDTGEHNNCFYARVLLRKGNTKDDCDYWKPIGFLPPPTRNEIFRKAGFHSSLPLIPRH